MNPYHRYYKRNKKERRKKQILFIIIVCLVCALALGGCIFYFLQKKKNSASGYDDGNGTSSGTGNVITYNGKKYVPNDHLSNYLFLGVDTDRSFSDNSAATPGYGGQADAIYLVSYDRAKKIRHTFAIPRDTMTEIETFSLDGNSLGYAKTHLSLQFAYGDGKRKSCELMETAVSKLLMGQHIDGYAQINLESISHLTELVDYVDVTVPDDSLVSANAAYKKGAQVRLTPENTEFFVRYRDTSVSQSAISRMNRQKLYIKAFADRIHTLQAKDSATVSRVYEKLQDYMLTNMSSDVFLNLEQADSDSEITTIPGKGTTGDVYDEYQVNQEQLYQMMIQYFYREA